VCSSRFLLICRCTPSSVSLLSFAFPPGPKRNKAFGAFGAGQPIGFIIGLIFGTYLSHLIHFSPHNHLGGILTESKATWRAIYYIQAGLGSFCAILAYFSLKPQPRERLYTKGLDWGGAFLSTTGVGMLKFSVV
jgi:MFS family permease